MPSWKENEIEIMKEIYPTGNIGLLQSLLKYRGESCIRHKASELGIRVLGDYTDDEKNFILKNYKTLSYKEISEILGRPETAIGCKINKMGLEKSQRWTDNEIFIIKQYYPRYGIKYIIDNFLPYRTTAMIANMVKKIGNLYRNKENKNEKYYDKEDLILWLKDLSEELNRTPKTKELTKYGLPHSRTYDRYFGTYNNACELAGLIPNANIFGKAIIEYSLNGDRCLSKSEVIVTNFFIENNISYKKEVPYSVCIPKSKCGNRIVDWIIGDNVFVEFFGMSEKEYYAERMYQKVKLCKDNNILLIELFRKDLKDLHRIFQSYIL